MLAPASKAAPLLRTSPARPVGGAAYMLRCNRCRARRTHPHPNNTETAAFAHPRIFRCTTGVLVGALFKRPAVLKQNRIAKGDNSLFPSEIPTILQIVGRAVKDRPYGIHGRYEANFKSSAQRIPHLFTIHYYLFTTLILRPRASRRGYPLYPFC